jgi:hypothetical protein
MTDTLFFPTHIEEHVKVPVIISQIFVAHIFAYAMVTSAFVY